MGQCLGKMLRYKISTGVAAERADASVDAVAVSNKMNLQKHEGGEDPSLIVYRLASRRGSDATSCDLPNMTWKGHNIA